MSDIYNYLREMDVAEAEIEQRVGEGWTLLQILDDKISSGSIDPATGYCMCGNPVDSHGLGDGHGPVDEGWYLVDRLRA